VGAFSPLISGGFARIISATSTSPLEMFRTFVQSNGVHIGALNLFRQLRSHNNLKLLWTGLVPTLWRDVPFSGIYWSLYEHSKKNYFSERNQFRENFLAGAFAGSVAAILTNPFDVIKTRRQMNIFDIQKVSTFQAAKQIYTEEGINSFFKGILPRAVRVAPACAIMISSYELVKKELKKRKLT